MNESKASSDEAIGRPQEWREGRYHQPGKPVESTVVDVPDPQHHPSETVSIPVTRSNYDNRRRH